MVAPTPEVHASRRLGQELTGDAESADDLPVAASPKSARTGGTMFSSDDPDTSTVDDSGDSVDPETFGQQTVWEENGD